LKPTHFINHPTFDFLLPSGLPSWSWDLDRISSVFLLLVLFRYLLNRCVYSFMPQIMLAIGQLINTQLNTSYCTVFRTTVNNLDDAGTVRSDETRLVLFEHSPFHADHVLLRNAFRYRNDQSDLGVNCFQDGSSGRRWRNVYHRRITLRRRFCLHPSVFIC